MEPATQLQPAAAPPASRAKKPAMKRWLVPTTAVLAVIALAVAGWMLWDNMNNQAEEETPTASVSISKGGFTPATIKIKKGQDITWTNDDNQPHQIAGDEGSPSGFKSNEALNKGDSYSFTFEESGTYHYHDSPSVENKGVIVVE
jgi:plastocyanin